MILIPAGEFLMGSNRIGDVKAWENELPKHSLYLRDYYIARTEVINAQYGAFVESTGYDPPNHWEDRQPPSDKLDHPVVDVSWYDAVAYCKWLSAVTNRNYRLPTEAEWEKAVRGTDGRIYPRGSLQDKKLANTEEGGPGDTMPVGTYPNGASLYGLLDIAGNVMEWCATKGGKSYPYDVEEDEWTEEYLQGDDDRVYRGGSWDMRHDCARCAFRHRFGLSDEYVSIGFRLLSLLKCWTLRLHSG